MDPEPAVVGPGQRAIDAMVEAYKERERLREQAEAVPDDLYELDEEFDKALDEMYPSETQLEQPIEYIGGYRDIPRPVELPKPPTTPSLWERIKKFF